MVEQKTSLAKKAFTLAVIYMVFHTVMAVLRAQVAMMLPPLMTFIVEDLGVDLAAGGLLQTTSTLVMGISMMFASLLIDRIGSSKTMVTGLVFCFLSGLFAFLAKSYPLMMVARIMNGIASGCTYPAAVTMVAERFTSRKARGMASSLIQATNSLANTITFSITVPMFMALGQNWNKQFMIWGVSCLGLALVWLIADHKPNKFFNEYNAQLAAENAGQSAVAAAPKEEGNSILKAVKLRIVWSGTICFTGATWLFMSFNTYLPTILKTVHGMTPAEASNVTGLISTAGLISCLICGLFLGKVKKFKPLFLLMMVVLPLSGAGAMIAQPGLLLNLCVILIGISWSCFVPVCNMAIMVADGVTPKIYAAANAVWTLLGNVLCMAMPVLFNALQLQMGMQKAALMMCLAGVITVIGALLYPSEKKAAA